MSPFFYRNAVMAGLILKEYKWTEEYISKYQSELPEDIRENYFNFCPAQIRFFLKEFEKSLELLSSLKHDELYLKTSVKIMQVQIYYELKHSENLISALESFRHFISNNKLIPGKRKAAIENFYKALYKLILVNSRSEKSDELLFLQKNVLAEKA